MQRKENFRIMSPENVKFDLSLQKLSSIAIAVRFWEKPDIIEKVRNYFDESRLTFSKGQGVINYIFQQLDLLLFPVILLDGIKILIVKLGRKIYSWRKYVNETLKLDLRYAEKIYWTCCGDINELKILKTCWLREQELHQDCCFMSNKLFCIAANYAEENYVKRNLEKFKQEIFFYINHTEQKQYWSPYAVISTWILFCTSKTKESALKLFRSFKTVPNQLPAKYLFDKCVYTNRNFGAKYFWKKLDINERQIVTVETAKKLLECFSCDYVNDRDWCTVKKFKLLLFLIKKMPKIVRVEFLKQNFYDIFKLCMMIWPYQDICLKFLMEMIGHVPDQSYNLLKLVIKHAEYNCSDSLYFARTQSCNEILQIVMERVPKEVKYNFFIREDYLKFWNLLGVNNFKTVALVIADPDLKEFQKELVNKSIIYFQKLVYEHDFKNLRKFFRNLKIKMDLKSLKEHFSVLTQFLILGKMDLAEQYLNWLSDSDAEKNDIKNEVDAEDFCIAFFRKNRFEAAGKFLEWRFNGEVKEIENLKETLKRDDFVAMKMLQIWGSNNSSNDTSTFAKKSTELLNFFLKSEEEIIKFKKKLVKDESIIERYWDALFYKKTFDGFDDFLKYCLFTSDRINTEKKSLTEDMDWWIDTFILEKSKFLMIDNLLDWACHSDEESKKKLIMNYMRSAEASICIQVFKNYQKSDPRDIIKFFNNWIDKTVYISAFKLQLDECDLVDPNVIKCIKFLFRKREGGDSVKEAHLLKYLKFDNICQMTHSGDLTDSEDDYYSGSNDDFENYSSDSDDW